MDSNYSSSPEKRESDDRQSERSSILILHNDDVNTFEFVMKTLEEVCNHTTIQAEQCAMLTHYKGSCEIMKGETNELRAIQTELKRRGLTVTLIQES